MSLTKLSVAKALDGLKNKDFTATELVSDCIKQCEANTDLNVFITTQFESAYTQAKAADERIAQGKMGLMEGIPIANKDLFCTKGVKTTAGSKILGNFVPTYESTVTKNLANAGAISLGKLNMDEFAMGSGNLNSAYGPAFNPLKANDSNDNLSPGGSSGGSAAVVSADMVLCATGSDTGGSIRQPASFCGIVGLKPTYGRCSRYGMVAFASSFDQAGPLAKTVEDSAIMLQAMASYDTADATSVNIAVPNYRASMNQSIKGKKVGVPKEFLLDSLASDVIAMWEDGKKWLQDAGAEIVEVSVPLVEYCLPAYYIMAPAEASSNLARYDGVRYGMRIEGDSLDGMYENTRVKGFGDEVIRRILIGTFVLSAASFEAFYRKAARVRRLIYNEFQSVFNEVDVLLTPTTPNSAFSAQNPPQDPITMYLNDILTVPVNLAGLPAISIPATSDKRGLPISLQLIAPAFAEERLIAFGSKLEQASNYKKNS